MEDIVAIIVSGIVATTLIAAVADSFTKARLARSAQNLEATALQQRVERLEQLVHDQQTQIGRLEADVAFTTKLLEKKE